MVVDIEEHYAGVPDYIPYDIALSIMLFM